MPLSQKQHNLTTSFCLRDEGKGYLRSSWRTGDILPLALQGKRFLLVSVIHMLSL